MNLLEIRKQFVKISGRYDLVDDAVNWSDNGADFYITAGQKFLDRLITVPENTATIFLPLASGEYSLTFQYGCRSVQEIYVNRTDERLRLEKISLTDLKDTYYKTLANTDSGAPLYYALANLRALETSDKDDLGTFVNNVHTESDELYDYRGLIIVPPVDEDYTVEIKGLFLQNELSDNSDENWWTTSAPDLLLKGALYQLESFSRGTENAKNWLSAIQTDVMNLEKDAIEEEIVDVDNMKG